MRVRVCTCLGSSPWALPVPTAATFLILWGQRSLSLATPSDRQRRATKSPGYKCEATVLPQARGVWDTALQACFPVGKT